MQEKLNGFFETLLMLLALGALVPIGQALVSPTKESFGYVIGRVILNAVFTLSAGLVLLWQPEAPTFVVLALGALLSSIGMVAAEKWAAAFLAKKFGGVSDGNPNS